MPLEPKIYCSFSKLVPVAELLGLQHPQNPKSHPAEQIAAFKAIITANGIRRPVTVSKLSGFVVAGHGLLLTLAELGWENYASATFDAEAKILEGSTKLRFLQYVTKDSRAWWLNRVKDGAILL